MTWLIWTKVITSTTAGDPFVHAHFVGVAPDGSPRILITTQNTTIHRELWQSGIHYEDFAGQLVSGSDFTPAASFPPISTDHPVYNEAWGQVVANDRFVVFMANDQFRVHTAEGVRGRLEIESFDGERSTIPQVIASDNGDRLLLVSTDSSAMFTSAGDRDERFIDSTEWRYLLSGEVEYAALSDDGRQVFLIRRDDPLDSSTTSAWLFDVAKDSANQIRLPDPLTDEARFWRPIGTIFEDDTVVIIAGAYPKDTIRYSISAWRSTLNGSTQLWSVPYPLKGQLPTAHFDKHRKSVLITCVINWPGPMTLETFRVSIDGVAEKPQSLIILTSQQP